MNLTSADDYQTGVYWYSYGIILIPVYFISFKLSAFNQGFSIQKLTKVICALYIHNIFMEMTKSMVTHFICISIKSRNHSNTFCYYGDPICTKIRVWYSNIFLVELIIE